MKGFIIGGLLAACLLAAVVGPFVSSLPDGLERVARDTGFLHMATERPLVKALAPDYTVPGVKNVRASMAVAGVLGTALVFGFTCVLSLAIKRKRPNARL